MDGGTAISANGLHLRRPLLQEAAYARTCANAATDSVSGGCGRNDHALLKRLATCFALYANALFSDVEGPAKPSRQGWRRPKISLKGHLLRLM